jgi:hypothetical protein
MNNVQIGARSSRGGCPRRFIPHNHTHGKRKHPMANPGFSNTFAARTGRLVACDTGVPGQAFNFKETRMQIMVVRCFVRHAMLLLACCLAPAWAAPPSGEVWVKGGWLLEHCCAWPGPNGGYDSGWVAGGAVAGAPEGWARFSGTGQAHAGHLQTSGVAEVVRYDGFLRGRAGVEIQTSFLDQLTFSSATLPKGTGIDLLWTISGDCLGTCAYSDGWGWTSYVQGRFSSSRVIQGAFAVGQVWDFMIQLRQTTGAFSCCGPDVYDFSQTHGIFNLRIESATPGVYLNAGSGHDYSTLVPEPGAWMLLAGGLLALMLRSRRS